jgi:hypothetical protein
MNLNYNEMINEIFYSNNKFKTLLNKIDFYVVHISYIEKICDNNEKKIKEECMKFVNFSINEDTKNEENEDTNNEENEDTNNEENEDTNNEENEDTNNEENKDTKNESVEYTDLIKNKIFNKIFKIIALKCHPDKCKDEIKNKVFIFANKLKDNKDINDNILKLLFLCSQCNMIDDINLSEEEYIFVEEILEETDKKILDKKNTIFYNWDNMNENQKKMYINILKKNYEKNNF